MPVFDYKCKNCGKVYEELIMSCSIPDADVKCPECGSYQSVKQMSAPSIGGSSSGSSANSGAGCGRSGFT
ncbi:zinc ribbon domain-containing protein [bacterium]|nr:zinc ribbon domain-containing protein [bacterium]MBU1064969.1 zinc ribbon domain-containing protein [bacterium]MBU1635007.1 zinc ribbon domain-containing protein [bacterium]MBU1872737.1 zinc ribbon domain-containing protein [bacterium]